MRPWVHVDVRSRCVVNRSLWNVLSTTVRLEVPSSTCTLDMDQLILVDMGTLYHVRRPATPFSKHTSY